jgi:hypothetical protein
MACGQINLTDENKIKMKVNIHVYRCYAHAQKGLCALLFSLYFLLILKPRLLNSNYPNTLTSAVVLATFSREAEF